MQAVKTEEIYVINLGGANKVRFLKDVWEPGSGATDNFNTTTWAHEALRLKRTSELSAKIFNDGSPYLLPAYFRYVYIDGKKAHFKSVEEFCKLTGAAVLKIKLETCMSYIAVVEPIDAPPYLDLETDKSNLHKEEDSRLGGNYLGTEVLDLSGAGKVDIIEEEMEKQCQAYTKLPRHL